MAPNGSYETTAHVDSFDQNSGYAEDSLTHDAAGNLSYDGSRMSFPTESRNTTNMRSTLIMSVLILCSCSGGIEHSSSSGSGTREITYVFRPQPTLLSRPLDELDQITADIGPNEEIEFTFKFPLRDGTEDSIRVSAWPTISKGSLTLGRNKKTLTFRADDSLIINSAQDDQRTLLSQAPHHFTIVVHCLSKDQTEGSQVLCETIIRSVMVTTDQGEYVEPENRGIVLSCEQQEGYAILTVDLVASSDFQGSIDGWEQAVMK